MATTALMAAIFTQPFVRRLARGSAPLLVPLVACLSIGLAFWVPAASGSAPHFPIPLDDTYIYFDFARSTAEGHLLSWVPGNGPSSGATSPLYALLLALGYLVGFRNDLLGYWAAFVALASLLCACRALQQLVRREVSWLAAVLLLSLPVLSFSFFSGMETALLSAVLCQVMLQTRRSITCLPQDRPLCQWWLSVACGALVVVRPECVPLVAASSIVAAHGAGCLTVAGTLLRVLCIPTSLLVLQGALQWHFTGEVAAAGAIRKLWLYHPYLSSSDVVMEWVKTVLRMLLEGLWTPLGGLGSATLAVSICIALGTASNRRLVLLLAFGAVSCFSLVCLNSTAPFQNFRYLAPIHLMLVMCLILAMSSSVEAIGRRATTLVCLIGCGFWLPATLARFANERDRFVAASRNIAQQQVAVGLRLGAYVPRIRRVFLGDAGAIPYFSRAAALDGLGLGGFRDMPFARASTHGVPAVIELIERMHPADRPDILAIYDSWWPDLGAHFGQPLFSVNITENVICADSEKRVYRADWSLLEPRDEPALDRFDVGDIVDEKRHHYKMPTPRGGYLIGRVLRHDGQLRYDAGRIIAVGQVEKFTLSTPSNRPARALRMRLDATTSGDASVSIRSQLGSANTQIALQGAPDTWSMVDVPLEGITGEIEVEVRPLTAEWRSYAYYLVE